MYFVANKTDFSIDFGQNVQENCFKQKNVNGTPSCARHAFWFDMLVFCKLCTEP